MQHLWAPWRMDFIKGPKPDGCFFCEAAAANAARDAELLVLARTELALALLNRYPYNNGHLGINAGKIAGAGVADHVHQHIVPRWDGDTNFMPVVAETKILNEHLTKSYQELRAAFDQMS
ncbi:MAG: HIT family hydrolase [Chloroflexi bacterium]|nr:MAG: HIT family hydrolase [Chloroflexota bacterium]